MTAPPARVGFLAPLFLLLPVGLLGSDLRFGAAVDRREVPLGDRVVVTYTARIPAGSRVEVEALVSPKLSETAPEAGPALDYAPPGPEKKGPPEADGLVPWSRAFSFTPLVSGLVPVPGPRLVLVSASGEKTPVRPPQVELKVLSRLPAGETAEKLSPKADRPARIPPLGPWFWAAAALLAGLAAAALYFFVRRRRKGAPSSQALPSSLPPGPEFLSVLDSLSNRLPSAGDDPRVFYSELTHATKRYLERQLKVPVLEWTTFETVRRLREKGWDLPRELGFSDLLNAADQVKFARGASTRTEAENHLGRARRLYEHVETTLAAASAASAAAPAARAVGSS